MRHHETPVEYQANPSMAQDIMPMFPPPCADDSTIVVIFQVPYPPFSLSAL
jgi:hypothetical protein